MSAIKEIRKQFNLSQPQLAAYLGISRSMLSMVEGDQRELTTDALKKLNTLGMSYDQSAAKGTAVAAAPLSVTELAVLRREVKKRLASTNNKLRQVQGKLNEMLAAYQAHRTQAAGLKKILAHQPKKITEAVPHSLLRIQLHETTARLYKCNPIRQSLLQIQLQALQLEASLLKELLQTPAAKLFSGSNKK